MEIGLQPQNQKDICHISEEGTQKKIKMVDYAAKVLPGSFPMVGGDGDHSYAKNSSFQVH